jgi:hypothetical protein
MDALIEVLTASVARRLEQAAKAAGDKGPPRPATPPGPASPLRITLPFRPPGSPATATAGQRGAPGTAAQPRPASTPAQPPSVDDFGLTLGGLDGFPAASPGPAGGPRIGLLAAFSGGPSLLAGIILSEALAPPLALRPHRVEP